MLAKYQQNGAKPVTQEEEKLVKERLQLLINAFSLDRCESKVKEDAIRSISGKNSFIWQLIDVVKDKQRDLPVTEVVDGVELRDFFWLMGDAVRNLNVTSVCQRPDPDGSMRYKIIFESTSGRNYFIIFSISKEPLALGISQDLQDDVRLRWVSQSAHFQKANKK